MAYEINININGNVEDLGSAQASQGVSKSPTNNEQEKATKALGKYVAAQTIQPFIQNVKTAVSQNVGIVTGSTELQERINFGMEVAQFGVQTFQNAQAGAVLGASLGIGGAAGALIGLSLTAINTLMQIEFNKMQLQLKQQMEGYQLQQVRERAGAAYNKSRLGGA